MRHTEIQSGSPISQGLITAPYNIGPILWTDIGMQVVLIALLIAYRQAPRPALSQRPAQQQPEPAT